MKTKDTATLPVKPSAAGASATALDSMISFGDVHYDPSWEMLQLPCGMKNVHMEHMGGDYFHMTRESFSYVLLLLERGNEEDVQRARAVLLRCLALQARLPGDPRDGLWHYVAEEDIRSWPFPDYNWADFNGMLLLMIWHFKRDLLDAKTLSLVKEAIRSAAYCVKRRNVTLSYTNIAIKGTFVTLAAGEILGDAELTAYALQRIELLHKEVFRTESFAEYNSPPYAGISIAGLMAIDAIVRNKRARALALDMQHLFWRHIALHFHVPTRELAGPHSRTYRVCMQDVHPDLGLMIQKATNNAVQYDAMAASESPAGFKDVYGYFLNPAITPEILHLLTDAQRVQTIVETCDLRQQLKYWWNPLPAPDTRNGEQLLEHSIPVRTTTHLQPAYALGSVNLQDGWEQRQNLIGYWASRGSAPSYLRHCYLHDARPCCSGFFASAQTDGDVLAATFLAEYTDHHVSVPCAEISAEYLGGIIEVNNRGEAFELWAGDTLFSQQPSGSRTLEVGEAVRIKTAEAWIGLGILAHESVPFGGSVVLHWSAAGIRIELTHYRGSRRTFAWKDFARARSAFVLRMGKAGAGNGWSRWQKRFLGDFAAAYVRPLETPVAPAVVCTSTELGWQGMRIAIPDATVSRQDLPSTVIA